MTSSLCIGALHACRYKMTLDACITLPPSFFMFTPCSAPHLPFCMLGYASMCRFAVFPESQSGLSFGRRNDSDPDVALSRRRLCYGDKYGRALLWWSACLASRISSVQLNEWTGTRSRLAGLDYPIRVLQPLVRRIPLFRPRRGKQRCVIFWPCLLVQAEVE